MNTPTQTHRDMAKREAASHVLAVMEPGTGYPQPGSFTESLIKTMALADLQNLDRLTMAFPYLGHAFRVWKYEGAHALREWGRTG